MSLSLVTLRPARSTDAGRLVDLWSDGLRRGDPHEQVGDLEQVIRTCEESAEQRLVVAEHDGELAGAVLLRLSTISPLNPEPTVQAVSPSVFVEHRRHGIGRLLMQSAVAFAEELGVSHLSTAAAAGSRDGNRFMARLALGPHATLRIAPVGAVRTRLNALRPASTATSASPRVSRVLAARRSMRRAQAQSAS